MTPDLLSRELAEMPIGPSQKIAGRSVKRWTVGWEVDGAGYFLQLPDVIAELDRAREARLQ